MRQYAQPSFLQIMTVFLLTGSMGMKFKTNKIDIFSVGKMHSKTPSAKWQPFCLILILLSMRPSTCILECNDAHNSSVTVQLRTIEPLYWRNSPTGGSPHKGLAILKDILWQPILTIIIFTWAHGTGIYWFHTNQDLPVYIEVGHI